MIRARLPRNTLLALSLGALFLVSSAPASAQARGILFGVVVDDRSDGPVTGAKVEVVGGSRQAETDDHGRFVLQDLPLGLAHLRVEQAGYSTVVEQIDLDASALVDIEVRLVPLVVFLRELSVTAQRGPKPTGYLVSEVIPAGGSDRSALDLLAAQVPGVRVAAGRGVAGQDATIGIRGVGTLTGSNAPIIYLDGIRIADHVTKAVPNGVSALSVLAQIPAREIARILVLRGPAAAMYPDAATGVIMIETVRGVGR